MRNLKFLRLSSGGNLDIVQASRAVLYFIHFLGKVKPYLLFLCIKSFCLRVHFLHVNLPEVIDLINLDFTLSLHLISPTFK